MDFRCSHWEPITDRFCGSMTRVRRKPFRNALRFRTPGKELKCRSEFPSAEDRNPDTSEL